jgi:GT2 family glycosyltransferase
VGPVDQEHPVPRVRLVVLNFDGGDNLMCCLEALTKLDWPADRLELVVVDNDSHDGSDRLAEERFDTVRLIRNTSNTGFPANNLALRDLDAVDYVGLVNPDAFVEPGWLRPLVETLEGDTELGAASARMVFADRFVDVEIGAPTFVPGVSDTRALGVKVSGLRVDGTDRWRDAQFPEGSWGIEHDPAGGTYQWTRDRAVVRVPVREDGAGAAAGAALGEAELRLSTEVPKTVVLHCGDHVVEATVGTKPSWIAVPLSGTPRDVVNNVGSVVFDDGYGADRGYLELDAGQYDEPADVFAWCGGSVLFRPAYLADVGLFDERFFLYYEDTDLSWRLRLAGWDVRYEPGAVVHHAHSATVDQTSDRFAFYNERNRLLMLTRCASAPRMLRALLRFLLTTGSLALKRALRRPVPDVPVFATGLRLRVLGSYARALPWALRTRRGIRRSAVRPVGPG